MEINYLIRDSRHGFRNKRSCLTSLLDFFDKVIDIYHTDNNKAVELSIWSFIKAFAKYHMKDKCQKSIHMAFKVMQPDGNETG